MKLVYIIILYFLFLGTLNVDAQIALIQPDVDDELVLEKDTICNQNKDSKIFTIVEQMPSFPGGEAEMMKFLVKNVKTPKVTQEEGIQGRVVVRFVVTKTGEVRDIKAMRYNDTATTKAYIEVIKSMPRWKPGKQDGVAVDVHFTLPMFICYR